jgi:hypothetical protein
MVFAWVNEKKAEGKHPEAIRYALSAVLKKKPLLPWPYAETVLKKHNGTFNERDYIKAQVKDRSIPDDIKPLIKKIGG